MDLSEGTLRTTRGVPLHFCDEFQWVGEELINNQIVIQLWNRACRFLSRRTEMGELGVQVIPKKRRVSILRACGGAAPWSAPRSLITWSAKPKQCCNATIRLTLRPEDNPIVKTGGPRSMTRRPPTAPIKSTASGRFTRMKQHTLDHLINRNLRPQSDGGCTSQTSPGGNNDAAMGAVKAEGGGALTVARAWNACLHVGFGPLPAGSRWSWVRALIIKILGNGTKN